MGTSRGLWAASGVVAGLAGLAVSHAVAGALSIRESPVVAVAELVIRLSPGPAVERAIKLLGHWDKPVLVASIMAALIAVFALAGVAARRSWWLPPVLFAALAAVGGVAVLMSGSSAVELLPVLVGFAAWLMALSALTVPLRRWEAAAAATGVARVGESPAVAVDTSVASDASDAAGRSSRRSFLLRLGAVGAAAAAVGLFGQYVGRGRRAVEETRRLLRLPLTQPQIPEGVRVEQEGVSPWRTGNLDFYLIHTTVALPTIAPEDYTLRIHGMVERELTLTYQDIVERRFTERWLTLNCVSNPVGGPLIGNAWWSGIRVADLLAEAGVQGTADAVLQTSHDGWTCGTPLAALTDGRDALLAVGMNGVPLPIEHGFPVRTIVPGLYGFVSACKWVVDLEVTRFDRIAAFWTTKGWSEQAPVKMSSRIDVPAPGAELPAGTVGVGGVAWAQHTGIRGVEIALDGAEWQPVTLGGAPTDDTWVQWAVSVELEPGDHVVSVRATDKTGLVQTGVERDVVPDGATGWHTVEFSVAEA